MKREGSLERCPVCRATLPVPTSACGEAKCPRCNCRLYHLTFASGPTFFVRCRGETIYDLLADLTDSRQGFSAADLERTFRDADSLDVAEFLLELEGAMRS